MDYRNDEYRRSASPLFDDDSPTSDWTIALAGGDGVRLADYVQQKFGQRIPKQYCAFLGKRSMLAHTLDRLNRITPAARTLTVIGTYHAEIAMPQLAGRSDHVFRQPSARDTGLAIYVALAIIRRYHPNAIVTITPSDQYITPAARYVEQVRQARGIAARMRDLVVVIGVRPSEPDPELGYLSLGPALVEVPEVRRVIGFVEKPTVTVAKELGQRGALWNTMVTCGTATALWELGRAGDPHLLDILDSLVPLIGSPDEDDAIEYIYRAYLPVNFSRDVLERSPARLAAMALDGIDWSDWGQPERIERDIAQRRSRAAIQAHGASTRALAP